MRLKRDETVPRTSPVVYAFFRSATVTLAVEEPAVFEMLSALGQVHALDMTVADAKLVAGTNVFSGHEPKASAYPLFSNMWRAA